LEGGRASDRAGDSARFAARRLGSAAVLVLLPPSEGKSAPAADAAHPPVDLDALIHPELTDRRVKLIGLLDRLARGPRKKALTALGLSAGQSAEVDKDLDLLAAPAAPAAEVYTGVLYQHLDLASLAPGARARAAERLLIGSALWGVVRLEDRIPAYRLSMNGRLPRIGPLATWWRPTLTKVLPPDGLVVDLRSQTYAAAWRPPHGTTVEVRVFAEDARTTPPKRTVVSHMAKATRGDVARILVQARAMPRTPAAVATLIEQAGHRVELVEPPERKGGRPAPWSIDVIGSA